MLPDYMCGVDTDELFGYTTKKVVWVRDRWIGILYYSFIVLIICWVIGFQILFSNEHFSLQDVQGTARVNLAQPTKNMCNPLEGGCSTQLASMSDLPYCTQSGAVTSVDQQKPCIYMDRHSIMPQGSITSTVFVPTYISRYPQKKVCSPTSTNDYSCRGEYEVDDSVKDEHFFVADVDDYLLAFSSTYNRKDIVGTSLEHQGFYNKCEREPGLTWAQRLDNAKPCKHGDRIPMPCAAGEVCKRDKDWKPADSLKKVEENIKKDSKQEALLGLAEKTLGGAAHLRSRRLFPEISSVGDAPQGKEGQVLVVDPKGPDHRNARLFSTHKADMFTVKELLALTGLDADHSMNTEQRSVRKTGAVIEIEAFYNNMYNWVSSFGADNVEYTYRMYERPILETSTEMVSEIQPPEYPKKRIIEVRNGILISFRVGGSFGFFNIVYLLVMLTTSLALFATATTVTDLIAVYLHPRKRNYFHLKYEVSPDFSDAWCCPKCNYYNAHNQLLCQGKDLWEDNSAECGCERPEDAPAESPRREHSHMNN